MEFKTVPLTTEPFDPAEYLDGSEAVAAHLTEAFETGDAAFISDSLGVVACAVGMSKIARDAALSRESLYRSPSVDGHPEIGTVIDVLKALGVKLVARPMNGPEGPADVGREGRSEA